MPENSIANFPTESELLTIIGLRRRDKLYKVLLAQLRYAKTAMILNLLANQGLSLTIFQRLVKGHKFLNHCHRFDTLGYT